MDHRIIFRSTFVLVVCVIIFSIVHVFSVPQNVLTVGGQYYTLTVAANDEARSKGLGGRRDMARNEGMLFVFEREAVRCFWMKNMQFSIDIIWLNAAKQVVHVEPNLSPKTFPKSFCPAKPAQYVVELRAGEAARSGVKNGQKLDF
ncbi:hypothetical protein CSA80_03110 [Candidatus Saccharibacteria bacterium]|nr:MAG: hypothetical protein CR973_00265 [Candidatus Saccharibacteria bacterium]PID99078.1 MAG: hypothetical protein CSA80_03110 [Candidatus Saccharibacteria bacterium]